MHPSDPISSNAIIFKTTELATCNDHQFFSQKMLSHNLDLPNITFAILLLTGWMGVTI